MQDHAIDAPIPLTDGEYQFLTDTLEPLTRKELQNGAAARFVVKSRNETLRRLVRCVFEQELTDEERAVAQLLLLDEQSIAEATRRFGLSRKRVCTLSDKAEKKLQAYLKYPFLMDFSLLCPSKSFLNTLQKYGGAYEAKCH